MPRVFRRTPKLIWHEDEPLVSPSSVSLYFVDRLAREHVTVVLTGEGSDETLGGYTRYAFTLKNCALDRWYRRVFPAALRQPICHSIRHSRLISAALRRKLSHTCLAFLFTFDNFVAAFSEEEQMDLLNDDVAPEFADGAAYDHALNDWEQARGDLPRRLLYTDIKTYLVELLMKQDNMSMAASIESRVPFLNHVLVEFAVRIPQKFQIRRLAGKQILKKAVQDLLPHSIVYRPKLGFPTPWSGWLVRNWT